MRLRIRLNRKIKEVETVVRESYPKGYQIAGYIPIMRDKILDGEEVIVLKFYDTKEQAEQALKEWEANPGAIKDTLVEVLVSK